MNRRSFLSLFGVTAAAIAADPDLLLWTPGAKAISIPRVIAPNIFEGYATHAWRLEMLELLKNQLVFSRFGSEIYSRDNAIARGRGVFREAAGASTFVGGAPLRREAGNVAKPISDGLLAGFSFG